jgi:hypothetical protein
MEQMRRPRRVPSARLPRSTERYTSGVAVSVLVHGGILVALMLGAASTAEVFSALGGPGPAGGGGGGGRSEIRYVQLSPAAASDPAAARAEQDQEAVELVLPEPNLRSIPTETAAWQPPALRRPTLEAVRVGRGPGTGGGPGAGTGQGGGIGAGRGTGIGAGQGPGAGGGNVFRPEPKMITIPYDRPRSVQGTVVQVHFWVDAAGQVTRVEVEPRIEDAEYRRKFLDQMYQFQFTPARTLDGTPVAGHVIIPITL